MEILKLTVEILSYWHAGSGLGRGADLDALVLRNGDDLPYLPGRTLKGLLREAFMICEEMGHAQKGRTAELFGLDAAPPSIRDFDQRALADVEDR